MLVSVDPKPQSSLFPTGIFHQTSYWGDVKSRLGWSPSAFNLEQKKTSADKIDKPAQSTPGDILIVSRKIADHASMAYVPYGPEYLPHEDAGGLYLEHISEQLRELLPNDCICIRYDLPWESPYARDEDNFDDDGFWRGPPDTRAREMRMNWGTEFHNLRKSASDIMPPDTLIIDLDTSEENILARMKPVTRRNIRISEREGVRVLEGSIADLDDWHTLYIDTARRNGFHEHGKEEFRAVLASDGSGGVRTRLFFAEHKGKKVAGLMLVLSGASATYLYGASSNDARDCRAAYALQWTAMRAARAAGALEYDMFGTSPRPDSEHPLYGLWRFKIGFGGRLLHRMGSWDYPLDAARYTHWHTHENLFSSFHNRS